MPESAPSPSSFSRGLLILLACAVAYGLFWLVGRPLLPKSVLMDRTTGLLPTLVLTAASISLLRRQPNGVWWAFGITAGVLAVYTGLLRVLF